VRNTGRSGATHRTVRCVHRTVRCKICATRLSRVFPGYVGYKSLNNPREAPDSPREAPDSPVLWPRNGYVPRRRAPTVKWCTGRSGAPQKRKSVNQGILCCVLCAYCSLSGAPPDRRQEFPSKWISNGSSCLRAIKETPRHMEHYTKHPLNILRCLDSAITQLDHHV
jgi:hypothetical protein